MNKYVFINVQGVSDVYTKTFNSLIDLEKYIKDFFCDDEDEYSDALDQLTPYGEINDMDHTLKVIEVKCE